MAITQLDIIYAFIALYAIVEVPFAVVVARKLSLSPILCAVTPILVAGVYGLSAQLAFTENMELNEPPGFYIGFVGLIAAIYAPSKILRSVLRKRLLVHGLNPSDIELFGFEAISAYLTLRRWERSRTDIRLHERAESVWRNRYPIRIELAPKFLTRTALVSLASAAFASLFVTAFGADAIVAAMFFVGGLFFGLVTALPFPDQPNFYRLEIEQDHLILQAPFQREKIHFGEISAFKGGVRVSIERSTPAPKRSFLNTQKPIDFIPEYLAINGFPLAWLLQRCLAEYRRREFDNPG